MTMLPHLWFDDSSKSIYCSMLKGNFSPTSTETYGDFLPLGQLLTQSEKFTDVPLTTSFFTTDIYQQSKDLKYLEPRLSTYYLFTTISNPLVRLVALYRTKVEHPLNNHTAMRNKILQSYRRQEYASWLSSNKSYELNPTFGNFIQYFISTRGNKSQDELLMFMDACQPCIMQYHYYMHPQSLNHDIELLARDKAMPIHVQPLLDKMETSRPILDLAKDYYSQLPLSIMNMLRAKMKYELELYYALYPEDRAIDRFFFEFWLSACFF